jgi:hypothetical protein
LAASSRFQGKGVWREAETFPAPAEDYAWIDDAGKYSTSDPADPSKMTVRLIV